MTFVHAAARLALAGLLGVAASWTATGRSRAEVPAERVLPGSTIAFAKVQDASAFREAIKSSQIGQLLADPAMEPLKQDILSKLADAGQDFEKQMGLSLREVLTLPRGETALAVIATPGQARPAAVYAVADAGENEAAMDKLMASATDLAKQQGATVREEEFEGGALHILQQGEDDPPVAWTKRGRLYHYATEIDVLKDILKNAAGREDCLAASEAYQAVVAKAGPEAQATWFLNLAGAVDLILSVMKAQDQGNALVIENQLELTGLDALQAIGGGLAFNVGPYDQLGRVFLYAPGEARGLLPLFQLPQVDLTPEPWVPASAATYQSVSWDLDAAYEALKTFTDTNFAQGMLEGLEQQIAGPQGERIRFREDIFGPLGDRLSLVSDYEQPGDETTQRVLFAVALEDATAFGATFDKVLAMLNVQPKKRPFEGTTIYEFEIPEIPNAEAVGLSGPVSVAIARDRLFVASPASILEQAVRGGGPALAQTPGYRAAAEHFPKAASTLSFTKSEEQARVLYNLVKGGQLNQAIQEAARNAGSEVPDEAFIDTSKIPPFSVFEKYISQSGGYGIMEPDGVTFTQFGLKKEAP